MLRLPLGQPPDYSMGISIDTSSRTLCSSASFYGRVDSRTGEDSESLRSGYVGETRVKATPILQKLGRGRGCSVCTNLCEEGQRGKQNHAIDGADFSKLDGHMDKSMAVLDPLAVV